MTEQQKDTYKKILLQTMKDFIKFCEENNLKYIAAYGTVLGAVRHKGLIPWDDDIDVYMVREDYNKFLSLKNKLINTSYEIIDHKDNDYYLPFAKFCNKHTTIWGVKELPFVMGVFIDIFPLDYVPNTKSETNRLIHQFQKSWSNYYRCLIRPKYTTRIKTLEIRSLLADIYNNIYKPFKKIVYSHFLKIEQKLQEVKGTDYIRYTVSNYPITRLIHPKSWIEDTIEVPFENLYIKIPREYDKYLTNEFGNYMKLPPLEKRISDHVYYFIDLTRRMTINEIKSIKNNKNN